MLETLKRHIRPEDSSLLELGCGTGKMLAEIGKEFPKLALTGIDGASRMCEKARTTAAKATIVQGFYGPGCNLSADIVVARSTLTYVDESDIENVLDWLVHATGRLLIISEPSGARDELKIAQGMEVAKVDDARVRLFDHSHVRDYGSYRPVIGLSLVETRLERAHGQGNRQWVFAARPVL
jgi:trans-aconitate methyltransferase